MVKPHYFFTDRNGYCSICKRVYPEDKHMDMYEVVEIETGARMSRPPKPGAFKEMNRKGEAHARTRKTKMG